MRLYVGTTFFSPGDDGHDGLDVFGLGNWADTPGYNSGTRVYSDPGISGNMDGIVFALQLGFRPRVGVVSGTGWTKGLYEVELADSIAGSFRFVAGQAGLGTGTPTLSTGPLATLGAAHALIPAGVTGPIASYAANAAVEIACGGTLTFGSKFSWTKAGAVGYHNKLTASDLYGNVGAATATLQPTNAFTTPASNALFEFNTTTTGFYLDVENIVFNASSPNNTRCQYACNLNVTIGYMSFARCDFRGAASSGVRAIPNRTSFRHCRASGNAAHGFYAAGVGLVTLALHGCEAHGNTLDGFNIDGYSESPLLDRCLSHNNGRHGFAFVSVPQSIHILRCVAAINTQHGFDLSGSNTTEGGFFNLIGNVSILNGSTSSHRQFNFSGTTARTNANIMQGNYAGPSGAALAYNAGLDVVSDQIATGSGDILRNIAVANFDGRLKPAAALALKSLVAENPGLGGTFFTPPGLPAIGGGGGSSDRVLQRS